MLCNLHSALAKHKFKTKETVGRLGLRLGIPESTMLAIIYERTIPTIEEKEAIAEALGYSTNLEWLFR
jgi:hypothetical protein